MEKVRGLEKGNRGGKIGGGSRVYQEGKRVRGGRREGW